MTYAALTRETPKKLKGFVHRRRLEQATAIINPSPTDIVLDYGCGDGHLFFHLLETVPATNLVGYDPLLLPEMQPELAEQVTTYNRAETLVSGRQHSFSVISCLEVCEHLDSSALAELFANLRQLARPNAKIVIGVPLETGLSGFLKNLYRLWHGGIQGATLPRAINSLFGADIDRDIRSNGWIPSHIGFREWRLARSLPAHGLAVERIDYLPFPLLGRFLNNEVYFTCRPLPSRQTVT